MEGQKGRGGACLSARLWPKVSHHIPAPAGAAFSQTGDQRRGEAGLGQVNSPHHPLSGDGTGRSGNPPSRLTPS